MIQVVDDLLHHCSTEPLSHENYIISHCSLLQWALETYWQRTFCFFFKHIHFWNGGKKKITKTKAHCTINEQFCIKIVAIANTSFSCFFIPSRSAEFVHFFFFSWKSAYFLDYDKQNTVVLGISQLDNRSKLLAIIF